MAPGGYQPFQCFGIYVTLRLAIDVVTDRSLTTQGDTTNPTGRIYPRRIIPWDAFAREQEKVWANLSFSPSFTSRSAFPSRHQLEYVKPLLHPISSEISLRNGERDVVENAVQKLMDATYADPTLRSHLGLNGTVTFESHTNLGITDESLSESMEQVSLSSRPASRTTRRRKARGKGNRIRTRSQCLPLENETKQSSDDDNEDDDSPSPTPNPAGRSAGESRDISSSETQVQGRVSDMRGDADKRQHSDEPDAEPTASVVCPETQVSQPTQQRHVGKAGFLHRDISISNLMMNEDDEKPSRRAFLIDLDLAIRTQREGASGAKGKTGTRAFMAIGALLGNEQHSFMHYLESFFWVLFWICIHYNDTSMNSFPELDTHRSEPGCSKVKTCFDEAAAGQRNSCAPVKMSTIISSVVALAPVDVRGQRSPSAAVGHSASWTRWVAHYYAGGWSVARVGRSSRPVPD